jgi:hypothetical protein
MKKRKLNGAHDAAVSTLFMIFAIFILTPFTWFLALRYKTETIVITPSIALFLWICAPYIKETKKLFFGDHPKNIVFISIWLPLLGASIISCIYLLDNEHYEWFKKIVFVSSPVVTYILAALSLREKEGN